MQFWAQQWRESCLRHLFFLLRHTFLPYLASLFFSSFLWKGYCFFDSRVLQSRWVQYLLNPAYLTNAWYESAFYRRGTRQLRHLSLITPAATPRWSALYPGLFFCIMLAVPARLWNDLCLIPLFFALAIFYFSHHTRYRTDIVFAFVNVTLIFFWILAAFAVPMQAVRTLTYLLLGIDLFFLISFSVRTEQELLLLLQVFYFLFCGLCAVAMVQSCVFKVSPSGTMQDSAAFGEIMVLLFPFSMVYPSALKSRKRRALYFAALMIPGIFAISAAGSRAALIGFWVEFIVFALFTDRRYLLFLLAISPVALTSALRLPALALQSTALHGNFMKNLYLSFMDFWNNGFGINKTTFLDVYRSTASNAENSAAMVQIPYLKISPVYFTFLIDAGAILMIGFLSYLLRLAHSTLTSIFTAQKQYRLYFAAGFATLIGISVSSMLESTLFQPRVLLLYWAMLGLIRAVRIVRFGIIM